MCRFCCEECKHALYEIYLVLKDADNRTFAKDHSFEEWLDYRKLWPTMI